MITLSEESGSDLDGLVEMDSVCCNRKLTYLKGEEGKRERIRMMCVIFTEGISYLQSHVVNFFFFLQLYEDDKWLK